ncbi:putative Mad3/BUB1 domain-containing protein [Encephalitozoon hellem]|nr:putative Mad3/BUB1 domain-containing protein [Encephalitozoon hellem]
MVVFDDTGEDELESTLLGHIDIPYFRNNPSYISLWQKYYYKNNNPHVLFLMKYKKISQYYHWIYVELSRFFMRNNHYGACKAILNMGIACNAYDRRVLEDELRKIPTSANLFSENEVNALLNPKGFTVLGKVWNSYQEALFYNRELFIFDHEEMSFEEYRSRSYIKKPRPSPEECVARIGMKHLADCSKAGGDGELENKRKCEPANANRILAAGQEIVIDGYTYYIKEIMGGNRYRMTCLSEEAPEDLVHKGDVMLQEVTKASIDLALRLNPDYVPKFVVKELGSRTFLLYEFCTFGTLENCLNISDAIKSRIALYFVSQLAEILDEMKEKKCKFVSFSLESLCVSEDCMLKIADFNLSSEDPEMSYEYIVKDALSQYCRIPPDGQDAVQKARSILRNTDLKGLITGYRIHLYERICGCY